MKHVDVDSLKSGAIPDLTDLNQEELTEYAQSITELIEPLKEEAKRVARAREAIWEREQEKLANRPKTPEQAALDQKVGSVVEEENHNG